MLNNILKNVGIKDVVIAILAIAFLYLQMCKTSHSKSNEPKNDTIFESDTFYDLDTYNLPTPGPTSYERIPMIIPYDVDTNQILAEYFAMMIGSDTITDSNLFAVIHDTISQNKIKGRMFSYRLLKPTVINNTTILPEKEYRNIYVGGDLFYLAQPVLTLNGNYLDKKKNMLTIGVGLGFSGKPAYYFGYKRRLIRF